MEVQLAIPPAAATVVNLDYQLKGIELVNQSNECQTRREVADSMITGLWLVMIFSAVAIPLSDIKKYDVRLVLVPLITTLYAARAYFKQQSLNLLSQAQTMFDLSNGKPIEKVICFKDPRV